MVRRAGVVGCGLIGASIALALRETGWHVTGSDADPSRTETAREMGALDATGGDPQAEVTFVATPVAAVADAARRALAAVAPGAAVTDVAGAKGRICADVTDPRFVGGHPMAGSEQVGPAAASATMFQGATWVLTPTGHTDPASYSLVQSVVRTELGANVVALPPATHDELVALVSHVPHLAAATLMDLAGSAATEEQLLLRLAAGGFRDMTRVAAGSPAIWPDVCEANAGAIAAVLDRLVERLTALRALVAGGDRAAILALLERAHVARRNLPAHVLRPETVAEVRVPVQDRPGMLADVLEVARGLGVNVDDVEIAHSAEGERGVLVMLVDALQAEPLAKALREAGHVAGFQRLETER